MAEALDECVGRVIGSSERVRRGPQSTRVELDIADVPPQTERPVRYVLEEDG